MGNGHQPTTTFGRRQSSIVVPTGSDPVDRRADPPAFLGKVAGLVFVIGLLVVTAGAMVWSLAELRRLSAESGESERQVVEIVNRPVTRLPRTAAAAMFSPGWFHAGAIKPDFGRVDIRASQEFPYSHDIYVTSDLNASEMFIARELEFNAMTKYFYSDYTLPKRRLSEADMIRVNDLYRVIGRNEPVQSSTSLMAAGLFCGGALLIGWLRFILQSKRRAAGSA